MKIKRRRVKTSTIVFILLIILLIVFYNPIKSILAIKNKGYSISSAIEIYKSGIKEEVLNKDYSKTLDNIITTDYYEKDKLIEYFGINYLELDSFNEYVSKWLKLGYNYNDINKIFEQNDETLNKKVSEKYIEDITNYLSYKFFKIDKLDRYLNYFNGDYEDTIIKVNIGLDKKFYEDPVIIKDYKIDVIVNKYNQLDSSFAPNELTELTKCSTPGEYLSKDAKLAYDELCDASLKEGLSLGVTSAYRSYENQQETYNYYLKNNGQEYADKYVSLPGYSEHQTGLALDVKSVNASPFKITNEYKWMINNAYKYGFILRYPENKEDLTGYNSETWHYRYVGKEIAEYIHDNDITFDEYCAIFM